MTRRISLYALLVFALGALLATACTSTGDDEDEQDQAQSSRAAELDAAARDAAAAAAAATPYTNERPPASSPMPISQQARRGGSGGAAAVTPSRAGTAPTAAPARMQAVDLQTRIPSDFPEFLETAWSGLPTSADHVIAWGIGSPAGDRYLIPVRIYDASTGQMLREVALAGGGALQDGDAVQIAVADSPIGTLIEAHGAAGAHGISYDLLVWNGAALTVAASAFTDVSGNAVAPGRAARIEDLDGDGIPEVIADQTDGYPFWYSSGVYRGDAAVMRWREYEFVHVDLMPDPSMSAEAAGHTQAAISLAERGWLSAARDRAAAAREADPVNETALWNHLVLQVRAEAAEATAADSPLPWAGAAINGDWSGAVELLRNVGSRGLVGVDAAFTNSPLEGDLETSIGVIRAFAEAAIEGGGALSDIERSPAWLIRGLAQWWGGEGYAAAEDSLLEAVPGYWDETFLFDLMYYLRNAP